MRAELDAEPDTAALFDRLQGLDPVAAGAHRARATGAGSCGPSRSPSAAAGRSRRSAPGSTAYPPAPFPIVGLDDRPAESSTLRIEQRYVAQLEAGFVAEVEQLLGRPAGLSRTARQALGYAELLDHLEHGTPLD